VKVIAQREGGLRMKYRYFSVVIILALALISSNAWGLSLTFEGKIDGHTINFTVFGNVGGIDNILWSGSAGTTWNHEWPITAIADWAILDDLVPSNYENNENAYGQMMLSDKMNLNGGFRYHELLSGHYPATLERWSHEIDIRPLLHISESIDQLIGVVGAFSYFEIAAYATNYTPDGSTTPTWVRNVTEGTLTLTYWDPNALAPVSAEAPIPEPSTVFLFGTGLVIFGSIRLKRLRKSLTDLA